jgi:hypothetical protein
MSSHEHAIEDGDFVKTVVDYVKSTSKTVKIECPDELYDISKMAYKTIFKTEWDITPHKARIFRDFYEVPDHILSEYENRIMPDDVVQDLLVEWAKTGLKFECKPGNVMVQAKAINNFLYQRTQNKWDTTKKTRMRKLVEMWDEACAIALHEIKQEPQELTSRRTNDSIVSTRSVRRRVAPRWSFAEFPAMTTHRNLSFYYQMLGVLNDMAIAFPNRRNNRNKKDSNPKPYQPTTSHVQWHFKTACLIAFHVVKHTGIGGNKRFTPAPLCNALKTCRSPSKFFYDVNDTDLETKMVKILDKLKYDIDILQTYASRWANSNASPLVQNAMDVF